MAIRRELAVGDARPRDTLAVTDPDAFSQLRLDLAVAVSAEALFTPTCAG